MTESQETLNRKTISKEEEVILLITIQLNEWYLIRRHISGHCKSFHHCSPRHHCNPRPHHCNTWGSEDVEINTWLQSPPWCPTLVSGRKEGLTRLEKLLPSSLLTFLLEGHWGGSWWSWIWLDQTTDWTQRLSWNFNYNYFLNKFPSLLSDHLIRMIS